MTTEQLKQKYGDEMVLTIPASKVVCNKEAGPYYTNDDIDFCVKEDGIPMLRWRVENDPSFRQLVVYALIRDTNGHVFSTFRKNGDERLVGKYSIGTGGHVQPDETFSDALFRELKEEVDITPDDMMSITRAGCILDQSSRVNSVHLGIVYVVCVNDPDSVRIAEPEKLGGAWIDENVLFELYQTDGLESWSEMLAKQIMEDKANEEEAMASQQAN